MQLQLFTAPWCGPCRTVKPILAELAREYPMVAFSEVDCDAQPDVAQAANVRSMPTLVLTHAGREVGRIVGARPRAFIQGVLDRVLAGDVAVTAP
jgi:thioredoxin